ncbi:hypothetical protein O1611_g1002 [Lasiodiplodia mahajangana]|uniref:Uncharacterized protein n=1 Tax=Lasiodiplodia mahajangana TaxID=1108764 RepID=A0ACC2JYX4_9PEZI|nr:hypothetical protein O1611_g1002 [Lasiodiplodia mahajangana]
MSITQQRPYGAEDTIMPASTSSEEPILRFTIDLAKPPRERYNEVVQVFGPRLSKVCLRRVYDPEENEEIKGIAAASGVPLYLLIALNSLLDCLLGCTSGAIPVSLGKNSRRIDVGTGPEQTRLLHFRTLDWGMDELRDLLVVLEFVDSSSDNPTRVISRSITYAGFVGSLTVIRPCHDCPSRELRWHQLLVLLGKRRSISSVVRSFLLHPSPQVNEMEDAADTATSNFVKRATDLTSIPSAPCYLTLCNGREAAVIVKDYITGTVRSTQGFIAQTNHDPEYHETGKTQRHETSRRERREVITSAFGVNGWIEESVDRLQCLQKKWDRLVHRSEAKNSTVSLAANPSVTERTLRKWLSDYPTLNECSHFTSILDPTTGNIRWLIRGSVDDPHE